MTYKTRVWIIIAIAVAFGISPLFINPIAQDPAYHLFADPRGQAMIGFGLFMIFAGTAVMFKMVKFEI